MIPADQWPRKLVYCFDPEVRKVFTLDKTAAPVSPFTGRVGCEDIFSEMAAEQIKEIIKSNPKMPEAYERFGNHLRDNEVDLQKAPAILGLMLQMDLTKERFYGEFPAKWANQLLMRNYRNPFVV